MIVPLVSVVTNLTLFSRAGEGPSIGFSEFGAAEGQMMNETTRLFPEPLWRTAHAVFNFRSGFGANLLSKMEKHFRLHDSARDPDRPGSRGWMLKC
jgi:hypothetical protein